MRKVFSLAVALTAGLAVAWGPCVSHRALAQEKDAAPKKQGLGATPAKSFRVPEGFDVELVYEVPAKEQGSWVAMCVDLKGRLIVSDQYGKLYRVTPGVPGQGSQTAVQPINGGKAPGTAPTSVFRVVRRLRGV